MSMIWYVTIGSTVAGLFALGSVHAASCETSSGSMCIASCSIGTATAVCAENSTTCSTSCSDSRGNMQRNLSRSISEVTRGSLDEYDIEQVLHYFDLDEAMYYEGERYLDTPAGTITIDVDPSR